MPRSLGLALLTALVLLCGAVPSSAAERPAALGDCGRQAAGMAMANFGGFDAIDALWPDFTDVDWTVVRARCVDLDGDGQEELLVETSCCTVSSPDPWVILRASSDGNAATVAYARAGRGFTSVKIQSGSPPTLVEAEQRLRRTDANCCPSGGRILTYIRWRGTTYTIVKRKRVRGNHSFL